jgi:hypothetical protein
MRSLLTLALSAILGIGLLAMSGCAGGGHSSVGVSSGNYWGPYNTYRPRYDYDYRYSHNYDSSKHKRRAVGRPRGDHVNNGQRQRPASRPSRSR